MTPGDAITVRDHYGDNLERVLVDWDEDYVFVCTIGEWQSAQEENRTPESIGFARRFVVKGSAQDEGGKGTIRRTA